MNPDTAPTTEAAPAASPMTPERPPVPPEALNLAEVVDAHDTLDPLKMFNTLAALDPAEEFQPPDDATEVAAEPVAETPAAEPPEEPVDGAAAETPTEAATETADAAPEDPDGLLDEAGQRQAAEQIARYKTLMQSIVQNKDIPDHLKAQLISEAAKGGIDLDPTKPIDGKKRFTNKQKWGIGIVGTLLFMMMAVGAGAAATKA